MAMPPRVLVVEDDQRLACLIRDYLQAQGYQVLIEGRGDRAIDRIVRENPDLVILDLMLPGKDGLEVCRSVRGEYCGPILMLTAREDDMDQVAGLEMGADDYVKKPVEPRVLLARIRALLRRVSTRPDTDAQSAGGDFEQLMNFGALQICRSSHTVFLDKQPVDLTTSEFELLWILASNAGRVMNRDAIFRELRGIDYDGLDRSVDIAVSRLRKKLEDDTTEPQRIKTIWRRGYLFVKDAWQ
jgi:DNA-binding response OmpR family regulator